MLSICLLQQLQDGHHLEAGSISFANNYAINETVADMPARDFSVEFWGRTPAVSDNQPPPTLYSEFFSYAAHVQQSGAQSTQNPFGSHDLPLLPCTRVHVVCSPSLANSRAKEV